MSQNRQKCRCHL